MKHIKFSTSKGNFVLVDLPAIKEDISNVRSVEAIFNGKCINSLKLLTEEQAAEIVDNFNNGAFRDYNNLLFATDMDTFYFCLTAIGSFQSLLSSFYIHLYKNPTVQPEYPSNGLAFDENLYLDKLRAWHLIEEKTFRNPIILKMI